MAVPGSPEPGSVSLPAVRKVRSGEAQDSGVKRVYRVPLAGSMGV